MRKSQADPKHCLASCLYPFFLGNIPQDQDYLRFLVFRFWIESYLYRDIQNPTILGHALGFMILKHLFLEKPSKAFSKLLLQVRRNKGNDLPFQLLQGPTEDLGELGIQIGNPPILRKYHQREWHKIKECSVPFLRFAKPHFCCLALGDVQQGFNRSGDSPLSISQWRCAKEKPLTFFSQTRKEIFSHVCSLNEGRSSRFSIVIPGYFLL
ncbi:hypothetical protein ES703_101579 [subsurface metagenome]